eukprot:TRINITY_DN195_c0_g1_i1.p1 TRINITY_DN195_c0_g1~~TRINITY_DN195_c0_g1_i1.p1  ORF type:complete len:123 (-),score=23.91 TRINITY_DN195_c0_g1_i1:113-481(-)
MNDPYQDHSRNHSVGDSDFSLPSFPRPPQPTDNQYSSTLKTNLNYYSPYQTNTNSIQNQRRNQFSNQVANQLGNSGGIEQLKMFLTDDVIKVKKGYIEGIIQRNDLLKDELVRLTAKKGFFH